jgi:hypothetical protein
MVITHQMNFCFSFRKKKTKKKTKRKKELWHNRTFLDTVKVTNKHQKISLRTMSTGSTLMSPPSLVPFGIFRVGLTVATKNGQAKM